MFFEKLIQKSQLRNFSQIFAVVAQAFYKVFSFISFILGYFNFLKQFIHFKDIWFQLTFSWLIQRLKLWFYLFVRWTRSIPLYCLVDCFYILIRSLTKDQNHQICQYLSYVQTSKLKTGGIVMDSKYPGGGTMVAKSLDFTISESLKNALFWIFYSPKLFLKLNFALSLRERSWTSTWNNQRNSTSRFMASKLQTISDI